jgi:hypothetical protein
MAGMNPFIAMNAARTGRQFFCFVKSSSAFWKTFLATTVDHAETFIVPANLQKDMIRQRSSAVRKK